MTAPSIYTHSPFLFHHVPNSPFLLPTRRPSTRSPIPIVPDVENSRNNNCSSSNLLRNGSFLSPTSVVPSNSNPTSPQATPIRTNVSSDSQREQVVPHLSPMVENKSLNRKERRLDMSPNQDTVPEINLFSGEEIFA
ncbi:uncharacterized protein LOC111339619 [Stylophora pistillata]|uniref:uncharacterized protein LOC111339619 n=1 Tax=Stylophora pistillata TaxID=50429 RepID=UPI000C03E7CE|nr:uncharacterized protein LOC111339619 [Stylophora pistillata]XP_022802041.1 uncharacterized protein LOC111339619 [Stylophora pistillata]XP_022802042.1 uncharacterized protein LOC111339619 [Stylophora pistillata]